MPNNEAFFTEQTEQSAIKMQIVTSYFAAWANVIKRWNTSMGYIDLFCGPGKYGDDKPSAPLKIIETVLGDLVLTRNMYFLFNDGDQRNIDSLRSAIEEIDVRSQLTHKIQYHHRIIDQDFHRQIMISRNMPVLSFVDPFGYKGLTMELINLLINNQGSDCIFFFNYNRINMALSSNTKFDEHLSGIFGTKRVKELKSKLSKQKPAQREETILNALTEALTENKSNYVLPFKFYSTDMLRTSHYIIFVTKHPLGCKIMKQVMYNNSKKDMDGIATFSFEDSYNFAYGFEQISFLSNHMDSLKESILVSLGKGTAKVGDLCAAADCDFTSHIVGKNVKDALKQLEIEEKIVVIAGRKQKTRNGQPTMPDAAIVKRNEV